MIQFLDQKLLLLVRLLAFGDIDEGANCSFQLAVLNDRLGPIFYWERSPIKPYERFSRYVCGFPSLGGSIDETFGAWVTGPVRSGVMDYVV